MSKLVGKQINISHQGLYDIKDHKHGHYYVVRVSDGWDRWEREDDLEKEYESFLEFEARKTGEKIADCELYFKEKGIVASFTRSGEDYGAFDLQTYELATPDTGKVESCHVWGRHLSVNGRWANYINDTSVYRLEIEVS